MSDSIYDLLNSIKQAGVDAVNDGEPMQIQTGTVKSLNPFTVDMGTHTVEGELLLISDRLKTLKDLKPWCSDWNSSLASNCSGHCSQGYVSGGQCFSSCYTSCLAKCNEEKLAVGDTLIILVDAGGEYYIAMDRVEVSDE